MQPATWSSGLLPAIQQQLGELYDVAIPQDVRDYLVTDRALLGALATNSRRRPVDEQLLVMEDEEGVNLALFVDQPVLARLAAADPRNGLTRANLADYWTLLEGISHFHYLAWNAARDKPVTLLELEMQAEIDKYASTRQLLPDQAETVLGAPLLETLFSQTRLADGLDHEEIDRYQTAAALAARYCACLESRYPGTRFPPGLLRELRTFYRLTQRAKIARIGTGRFA